MHTHPDRDTGCPHEVMALSAWPTSHHITPCGTKMEMRFELGRCPGSCLLTVHGGSFHSHSLSLTNLCTVYQHGATSQSPLVDEL